MEEAIRREALNRFGDDVHVTISNNHDLQRCVVVVVRYQQFTVEVLAVGVGDTLAKAWADVQSA